MQKNFGTPCCRGEIPRISLLYLQRLREDTEKKINGRQRSKGSGQAFSGVRSGGAVFPMGDGGPKGKDKTKNAYVGTNQTEGGGRHIGAKSSKMRLCPEWRKK